MARILAQLENDTIIRTVVGWPVDFPGFDDVTDLVPQPGVGWQKVNGVYVAPTQVVAEKFGVLKAEILREMTPAEYATWEGVAQAVRTNPGGSTQAQRNALKALAIFNAYPPVFDKRESSFAGLKTVWVAAGVVATEARANTIIAAALTD